AGELAEKARYDEAIEALRLAASVDAENEGIRSQLFDIYTSAEDFTRAGECATTVAQFTSIADSLELRERHDEAIEILRRAAAAALQEFVTRVPSFIPALMRLVEICVDGGLEATMYSAQAQLADAYIAIGSVAEARFIAEDLVAREPWERANIERFRRTLELL